jgi:hypothetical protein
MRRERGRVAAGVSVVTGRPTRVTGQIPVEHRDGVVSEAQRHHRRPAYTPLLVVGDDRFVRVDAGRPNTAAQAQSERVASLRPDLARTGRGRLRETRAESVRGEIAAACCVGIREVVPDIDDQRPTDRQVAQQIDVVTS